MDQKLSPQTECPTEEKIQLYYKEQERRKYIAVEPYLSDDEYENISSHMKQYFKSTFWSTSNHSRDSIDQKLSPQTEPPTTEKTQLYYKEQTRRENLVAEPYLSDDECNEISSYLKKYTKDTFWSTSNHSRDGNESIKKIDSETKKQISNDFNNNT